MYTIRRFKLAAALNVLGLSVAFAAFMVIMMQLDYDYGFDKEYNFVMASQQKSNKFV